MCRPDAAFAISAVNIVVTLSEYPLRVKFFVTTVALLQLTVTLTVKCKIIAILLTAVDPFILQEQAILLGLARTVI